MTNKDFLKFHNGDILRVQVGESNGGPRLVEFFSVQRHSEGRGWYIQVKVIEPKNLPIVGMRAMYNVNDIKLIEKASATDYIIYKLEEECLLEEMFDENAGVS